ncbi:MAG: DUF559 domain-containing protein [Polyangiaceae bacterium]|nr:DUF559 domain-containing protein [Polyangiaceae bacterium]
MGRSKCTRLLGHARRMRATPTTSEAILWEALRGSQVGVMFRRQVVIGPYIVDFCAPSVRLVVEVDGGYHSAGRGQTSGEIGRLSGWGTPCCGCPRRW